MRKWNYQMENIQKWLEASNLFEILGAFGWLVGIVSGWLQWKGYRDQKKFEGAYQTIFEQAQRDWQGRYTEEQIKELTAHFKRLEEQIRREIPKESRKVFLRDQRYILETSLGELYKQHSEVTDELATLGVLRGENDEEPRTSQLLDQQISRTIEDYILPRYLQQEQRNQFIFRLIIVIFIASVFPYFLVAQAGEEVIIVIQLLFAAYASYLVTEYIYADLRSKLKYILSRLSVSKKKSIKDKQ